MKTPPGGVTHCGSGGGDGANCGYQFPSEVKAAADDSGDGGEVAGGVVCAGDDDTPGGAAGPAANFDYYCADPAGTPGWS